MLGIGTEKHLTERKKVISLSPFPCSVRWRHQRGCSSAGGVIPTKHWIYSAVVITHLAG